MTFWCALSRNVTIFFVKFSSSTVAKKVFYFLRGNFHWCLYRFDAPENLTFCWKPSLYEIWHERSLWAGAASQTQLISKFDFPFKFGIGYHVMRQRPRDVTLYRKSHVTWHLTARVLVMLSRKCNVTWHWVSYKVENLTKTGIRRRTSKKRIIKKDAFAPSF